MFVSVLQSCHTANIPALHMPSDFFFSLCVFFCFSRLVIPLIMAVVLVPHVLEPEDVGEKANAYSQALHFLQQVNHVFDSLLNLSPLDKAGIFVGAFLVVFIVRRCLLQKQLSALREKVISKQGEQTLRTNLVRDASFFYLAMFLRPLTVLPTFG